LQIDWGVIVISLTQRPQARRLRGRIFLSWKDIVAKEPDAAKVTKAIEKLP